ncbi:hypothetical protein D9758_007318 [Tetrapyrgos nigripes]|uniref:Carboxylic ester hydrolase n=1 Tax=Tetrapyrgos nigripes TaxID=182062 RepID=A0A8H5GAY8_9AGAR|nr:hypothetical protein D9758_007318 [Tetrapyrgos nigripes]
MARIHTTLGLLPCILSLASLTLTLCHPLATASSDPQVFINDVTFIGRRTSGNVEFFGGIPFAEAPVDDLRLRPPVLKSLKSKSEFGQQTTQNTTTFNATQFGPSCIQTLLPADQISEDCLSLNIFRPRLSRADDDKSKSEGLPVMVWFYGGGFIVGSASQYDGTPLVNRSVYRETPTILITANYRLGPLGFPRGDDVAREAVTGSGILNLGLQDNIAALQWIQENVAFFGGDPSKVTVFGESAGAFAIQLLLLRGKLQSLARGAIMESTGGLPTLSPSGSAANTAWSNFMEALPQCANTSTSLNDVECIRNLTTSELIDGFNNAHILFNSPAVSEWIPTLDSEIVPAFPSTLRPAHGAVEAVVIGCNKDEATLVTAQTANSTQAISDRILSAPPSPPDASTFEREAQLKELEHILNQTLALYPNNPSLGSPFDTGNETFGLDPEYKRTAAVSTDMEFQSMRRFHLDQQLLPAGIRSYSFLFADPDAVPVQDFVNGSPAPGSLGVTHSSEIFYVFGTLAERPEVKQVTPTAAKLSEMMMDYWISFANVLDPNDDNGANRPDWPEYTAENQIMLQLNGHNTTAIPDDFRKEQIALFNRNPAVFGY